MDTVIQNTAALLPSVLISWGLLIVCAILRPQRFSNSFLLMIACFFTLLFAAGLFGDYMAYALLGIFLLVMLALFSVPLLLILSGIRLIRRESFSFPHLLALLLGVFVGTGEIAAVIFVLGTADYSRFGALHASSYFLAATVFYFSCLILCFVLYTVFIQLLPHRASFRYIIIHGCGLADGYGVTRLLGSRIDRAIALYHRCRNKPILIASGGKGSDEQRSEAEAIAEYLTEHGIPADHVLKEDRSATTMENLLFSKRLIDARGPAGRVALISSNYHVYRCLLYARSIGLRCVGIGARVALYYWPTALIREFAALFRQKRFAIPALIGYAIFLIPALLLLMSF